jgi:phosphatidylcholine synthase
MEAIRYRAWAVHLLTASGTVLAFLAAAELFRAQPDPRAVFGWLIAAVIVDAVDGPLARAWQVKKAVPHIEGRTIDDIVDYMTFTFVPLLLVARLAWVPEPVLAWVGPALVASVLGFANTKAKQEAEGFFLGFPSYWNVFAFYAGIVFTRWGPVVPAIVLAVLVVASLAPLRFVYPNLAPPGWRAPMIAGAVIWALLLLAMLPSYPSPPLALAAVSFVYPAFYLVASFWLDARARRGSARSRL